MQLIIQIATVATLIYTLSKFAQKPNKTQDSRLDELEKWRESVELRLDIGNKHFEQVDEGERVTQKALLALMSHALNGNDVDKLKDAKDALEAYLLDK